MQKNSLRNKKRKIGRFQRQKKAGRKEGTGKNPKKKAKLPEKHPFEAKPSCKNKEGEKHDQKKRPQN